MKTFIESQFNYCPLVWMFHSRDLNQKINKLHERALRVVYNNNSLTFQQLLVEDGSFTIHERNLQKLVLEMYNIKNNLSPPPLKELFIPATRGKHDWAEPRVRTVNRGLETMRYRGPETWKLLSESIRKAKTLAINHMASEVDLPAC